MTLEDIEAKVAHIEEIKEDDESAHGREDDLAWEFISYCSTLGGELSEMAKAVLKSKAIEFARWCS